MLEILALFGLCKYIGGVVREKGRRAIGWQVMAVLMWLGGEVVGGFAAAIVYFDPADPERMDPMIYVFALLGAVAGAALSVTIAKLLPPV